LEENDIMPVIRAEKITKVYSDNGVPVTALKEVDLEIDYGEFVAVVGPSGSGKTTLLNIIGGLDGATSGRLYIEDNEITDMKSSRLIDFRLHNIGFVFQSYNLIPVLTALENVEFIMLLQKRPKSERRSRARELLESVGLQDHMNRRPNKLSGGQQQRVAVARALASRPKFVLADEPTANLDTASAENLLDIMEKLNLDNKTTFIFSSHDPRVVKRARRVIRLRDGRVVSDENPQ
jgi:putative ABC transport system ATP-binding protein